MLKILDRYILKQYLGAFLLLLCLFIPIMITVHIAEKIGKILSKNIPFAEVMMYLLDFTIYFSNFLFPIFLFISTMFFTSKLANNTEIVAFLSSGVSYNRFLRPYIIGAVLVCVTALVFSTVFVPDAAAGFNEFQFKYFKSEKERQTNNVFRRISDDDYVYVSNYNSGRKTGYDFTLEHFNGNELEYKLYAERIAFKDSIYTLSRYKKRVLQENGEILTTKAKLDTILNFDIDELTPSSYVAETLSYQKLLDFIETEESRGNGNMNVYYVEKHKRTSIPVSALIFTIIAVAVSSVKKRGGMGVNLAIGLAIAMSYMFLDKVFGTIAEKSTSFEPWIAVWAPNIFFGIVALFLIRNARR
ncbi:MULTISPECIES: LptF/LptG family permease [Nonlabens]|uniref:Membrane protein n=3 Tax=Nonlabens ulvanivorans TaxID=906888 RepID=A0A084JZM9_NONUL|nr:LptF/LptG family permease [Nonlabens ulvanivorans]KEZ94413.1 membrane protein [Nonlabens ulvanivorans]WOI21529.1 LptF/LptG family permease [Nonlabens ulvanivorans]GAL01882.1 putative membrane protein [Nonlabens ulvanivorans]